MRQASACSSSYCHLLYGVASACAAAALPAARRHKSTVLKLKEAYYTPSRPARVAWQAIMVSTICLRCGVFGSAV